MNHIIILSISLLVSLSSAAQVCNLKIHGEVDWSTNIPSITIYRADNSVTNLGTGWTNSYSVTNGDIWDVSYPISDCQTNTELGSYGPVVLNGVGTNFFNGSNYIYRAWIRMPMGCSGATYQFSIDANSAASLQVQCIATRACNPATNFPTSRLSMWGNGFYGTADLASRNFLDLAVADGFAVVLQSDHTVLTFPLTQDYVGSPMLVPPGVVSNNVVQVACGGAHALALLNNGTVAAWGANFKGQATVPAGLTGVTAVACGYLHSLALLNDGSVVSWGISTNVPPGLSGVVQVAAGEGFSVALKSDGTVTAWGNNWYGQTNVPAGLSNVIRVTCGSRHSAALKSDGSVTCWGGGWSSPSTQNVIYSASTDRGDWLVKSDGSLVQVGADTISMPLWGITNIVQFSARGSSHALISGPVLLELLSNGGTNANVQWPAAVAGRIGTVSALGNSWSLASNTVKYVREQKHINVPATDPVRFFSLRKDTNLPSMWLGEDALAYAAPNTGDYQDPGGSPPGPAMMQRTMQALEDAANGVDPNSPPTLTDQDRMILMPWLFDPTWGQP